METYHILEVEVGILKGKLSDPIDGDKPYQTDRQRQKGNANRATLAVARKLVAYLMAVDRGQTHFLVLDNEARTAA